MHKKEEVSDILIFILFPWTMTVISIDSPMLSWKEALSDEKRFLIISLLAHKENSLLHVQKEALIYKKSFLNIPEIPFSYVNIRGLVSHNYFVLFFFENCASLFWPVYRP